MVDAKLRMLSELLDNPREDLHIEIKGWLDLRSCDSHQAILAKAVMAIANFGGGYIILGMQEKDGKFVEADDRPADFKDYTQDLINGKIERYCDPSIHCRVHYERCSQNHVYPIVEVPDNCVVPIMSRRSVEGKLIKSAVYTRVPGPRSCSPQCSEDWRRLIHRCRIAMDKEEQLTFHQTHTEKAQTERRSIDKSEFTRWIERGFERWKEVLQDRSKTYNLHFDSGYCCYAYSLQGHNEQANLKKLNDTLLYQVDRYSGLPPFCNPSIYRSSTGIYNDSIECQNDGLGIDYTDCREPEFYEFWRYHGNGSAFLIRGHQEDGQIFKDEASIRVDNVLNNMLPAYRMAEVIEHAKSLARQMYPGTEMIEMYVKYSGLLNRVLVETKDQSSQVINEGARCRQDEIELNGKIGIAEVETEEGLTNFVLETLRPLYQRFGFYEPRKDDIFAGIKWYLGSKVISVRVEATLDMKAAASGQIKEEDGTILDM